ncbi:tripartite tricarboxylate transporter substrate binding protein [Orrella sp. NBD-18]|uniref:Tripartite tricarboxylate transporter substrate binding protein n=1 Tax=Sheuella amnicola TaxID=2707330 RepID=A0A6B2R2A2_9BURK|nr:tripartite tricarboxylate transporter substrate binding protein [Sheuella amnicola]NDY83764.1 tripartite tricarboxylate transporter substrate binding protein [Sheuella amnicola]
MISIKKAIALALGCASCIGTGIQAQTEDFPKQPIKLIVPWAPGGNVDITARAVAPAMSEILGQQVVVENKPGAGGFIGTTGVVRSPPDGYTLMLGSSGSISVGPALARKPPYDPTKDLVAIGPIHSVPIVMSASAKGNIKNFDDFKKKATTSKDLISIGSAGNGSSQHLALELLALRMGIKLNHIPYKGSGPALNDVVGGQIDMMMDQLTASISHIRNGTIIPIAQTGKTRSPLLPNVPTFGELGIKDFEMVTYTGIFGPTGISQPVLDKLTEALKTTLTRADVKERFAGLGVDIITVDRATFQQDVNKDFANSQAIGKAANIVINE